MSIETIEAAIPHRYPMRLVDQIVSQSAERIVCSKTFLANEFFVQGHFPGFPIVPGVIQCECCLQAGAILVAQIGGALADDAIPIATRMDNVKFKQMVRPGDTVQIEVTLNEQLANAYFMTGKVTCQGKLAARLDFACAIASVSSQAHERGATT